MPFHEDNSALILADIGGSVCPVIVSVIQLGWENLTEKDGVSGILEFGPDFPTSPPLQPHL